ncbi:hypothetical protein, partial [Streptomyces sp. NPDC005166]
CAPETLSLRLDQVGDGYSTLTEAAMAALTLTRRPRRPASGATAQLSVPGELPQCITKYPKLCCRKSIRQERTRP